MQWYSGSGMGGSTYASDPGKLRQVGRGLGVGLDRFGGGRGVGLDRLEVDYACDWTGWKGLRGLGVGLDRFGGGRGVGLDRLEGD